MWDHSFWTALLIHFPYGRYLLLSRRNTTILLQPLQLFSNLDLPVPRILIEVMPFPWKNQQRAGNAKRMQRMIKPVRSRSRRRAR